MSTLQPLLTTLLLLLCQVVPLTAQKEGYIWYFGRGAGVNFNTPDNLIDRENQQFTQEGCVSICDAEGNLLFYSNGGGRDTLEFPTSSSGKIWNRNHEVMYDMGSTEGGGLSAAQSSVVIPRPGRPNQYYLFTMDEAQSINNRGASRGLSYFIIDMTQNNGLGGVIDYQASILPGTYSESLAALRRPGGEGYWIVVFQQETSSYQFVAVTQEGVLLDHSDTNTGSDIDNRRLSHIKFSPNGRFMYAAGYLTPFDPQTGYFTGPAQAVDDNDKGLVGASFSSNSRYFYSWEEPGQFQQFDLEAADILGSRKFIDFNRGSFLLRNDMATGPYGSIYLVEESAEIPGRIVLSALRCVNTADPFYEYGILTFDDGVRAQGLPNFLPHYFVEALEIEQPDLALQASATEICLGDTVVLDAISNSAVTYQWSTGDTTTQILVNAPGQYYLTVTDAFCAATTDSLFLPPPESGLRVTIAGEYLTCSRMEATLEATATEAIGYEWSTGATTPSIQLTEPDTYAVTVSDACGGTRADTFIVLSEAEVVAALEEQVQPVSCFGTATGGVELIFDIPIEDLQFQWFDNSGQLIAQSDRLADVPIGVYTVDVSDERGLCLFAGAYEVTGPTATLALITESENTDCLTKPTSAVQLTANGGTPPYQFLVDGSSLDIESLTELGPGTYTAEVRDANNCSDLQEVLIPDFEPVLLELSGPSAPVPPTIPFALTLSGSSVLEGAQINWSPAELVNCMDCDTVQASIIQPTIFEVQITTTNGCVFELQYPVEADLDRDLFSPTAFSPNGDDRNDQFQLFGGPLVQQIQSLEIYDRWGNLVFQREGENPTWDGTFRNQPAPSGPYVWVAEVVFLDTTATLYKGMVTLLR